METKLSKQEVDNTLVFVKRPTQNEPGSYNYVISKVIGFASSEVKAKGDYLGQFIRDVVCVTNKGLIRFPFEPGSTRYSPCIVPTPDGGIEIDFSANLQLKVQSKVWIEMDKDGKPETFESKSGKTIIRKSEELTWL